MRFLLRWWWLAVGLLFIACVALKLNGSSIGQWQTVLREPEPIRGLVAGTPKNIRSDEWVVWTPSILSQARQTPPFPIENPSLGAGRAPLLMSLPVAYYTTVFRPQLWGFFLLDPERGFSWYWCAKVFGMLLALWWFFRMIGIESRGIALFGSSAIFFSSFTQWWFSSPAMLPEMVASWAMCIGCVIACLQETNRWRLVLAAAGLLFFGVNFVLCLYPPFQVPLAFLAALLLGTLWIERSKTERAFRLSGLPVAGVAILVSLLALVPFWLAVWPTLQIVAATEYPGGRQNTGGGYSLWKLLAGPIGFFESETRIPPEFPNIAEASNFYPLSLLALSGVVAARIRNRTAIPPVVIGLVVFMAALGIYCTVELPSWLLRVTLLAHVHEARALLSLGVANIILAAVFLDRYRQPIFGKAWGAGGAVLTLAALALLYVVVHRRAPAFFEERPYLFLLIGANALVLGMFFWDAARRWLPIVFAALLISSNGLINPIVRGLGAITDSAAYAEVDKLHVADPHAKWIAYGDHVTGQLIKTTGASVLNGTKIVPDLAFWRSLDAAGAYQHVYNRYAWIICVPKVFPEEVSFALLQMEFYTVDLPPGLKPLAEADYDYYVFPEQWRDAPFYDFALAARTPNDKLWIYRRQRPER